MGNKNKKVSTETEPPYPTFQAVMTSFGQEGGCWSRDEARNSECGMFFDEIDSGMGNYGMVLSSRDRTDPVHTHNRFFIGTNSCGLFINRFGDGEIHLAGKLRLGNKPTITPPTDLASAIDAINKISAYLGL